MEIIKINNLCKKYKNKAALTNISLSINEGEIVGLIGGNGAGKSTLIKCIGGLVLPTSGSIVFPKFGKKYKEHLSIMLEGADNLYHFLTVNDNVKYFLLLNKINYKDIEVAKRTEELLDLFSLKDVKNITVNKLSRGMQQKVALLISFLKNPDILILDEPTLGLDLISTIKMKHFLKGIIHQQNKTIIICSHDLNVIQEICNKLIILKNSQVVYNDYMNKFSFMPGNMDNNYDTYIIYFYSEKDIASDRIIKKENDIYCLETNNLCEDIKFFSGYNIIKIEKKSLSFEDTLSSFY